MKTDLTNHPLVQLFTAHNMATRIAYEVEVELARPRSLAPRIASSCINALIAAERNTRALPQSWVR